MSKVNDFLTNSVTVNYPENVSEQLQRQARAVNKRQADNAERTKYRYFFDYSFTDIDGKDIDGSAAIDADDIVNALDKFTAETGIAAQSITYIENR